MRSRLTRRARTAGATALVAAASWAVDGAAVAVATPRAGFSVEVARVEGVTPDVVFTVEGLGDYRGALEFRRTTTVEAPP
ncbi:MAG: hypothetical protein ACRDY7_03440, partial [Acidimicrobiia bacterium]